MNRLEEIARGVCVAALNHSADCFDTADEEMLDALQKALQNWPIRGFDVTRLSDRIRCFAGTLEHGQHIDRENEDVDLLNKVSEAFRDARQGYEWWDPTHRFNIIGHGQTALEAALRLHRKLAYEAREDMLQDSIAYVTGACYTRHDGPQASGALGVGVACAHLDRGQRGQVVEALWGAPDEALEIAKGLARDWTRSGQELAQAAILLRT